MSTWLLGVPAVGLPSLARSAHVRAFAWRLAPEGCVIHALGLLLAGWVRPLVSEAGWRQLALVTAASRSVPRCGAAIAFFAAAEGGLRHLEQDVVDAEAQVQPPQLQHQ